jgi:hypothetical protein
MEGILPNSYYEASIILTQKTRQGRIQKEEQQANHLNEH